MNRATHTCTYCSRNFKRAEHLTRHLRTHTREKPYSCRCGATFTRRDLLTRHWRLSQHAGRGPSSESERLTQNGESESSDIPVLTNEHHVATPAITPIVAIDTPQHILTHHDDHDFHEPVPIFDRNPTRIVNTDFAAEVHEDPADDFRDFINFIDGVGLSAQWTPEYDFDWNGVHDTYHESRRSSVGHHQQRASPGADDIGTPFSSWLPSAPADNQIHLRLESDDDIRDERTRNGPFRVTEEHRLFLVKLLKDFQSLNPSFEIPSRHTLTRYITAFFGGFHSHFPFIHMPTYKPTCSPLELTLAMCAAGAQYCFERRSAERLFRMAKSIVFERLQQEKACFGPQTLSVVSMLSPQVGLDARRLGPWSPLDLAKTLLILVGFATWERKDLLEQAFCLRDLLVHVLRDIGLREKDTNDTTITSPSARWDRWIQQESTRRTKLVAFTYINVHTVAYNVHPSLWTSELHLQLPCRTAEWQASSANQWIALTRDEHDPQMPFQQALSILLSGSSGPHHSVQPIPSPIGNYILLHALLQRIHVVRELSYLTTSPASVSSQDLQTITRALRSWTSLWQQAPESILDPNNESGPIPFTSSALLVIAYIRLSLNIGPHRHLFSRDARSIAAGLSSVPDIEHNDNLLSALLYSTHALSIPVRLGIDRVARSQAFFWSVQHAVSSFECAVFLAKWLCSLPRRLEEKDLTRSEHRILHWVRCIIKEAYAVIDFEEEEQEGGGAGEDTWALGMAVLKIWTRFFRGNTQWQFVVNLGLSLECYMEGIKARAG